MTLIVCVDDKLGMAFNKRRQSRDSAVCKDIAEIICEKSIGMDERSKALFEETDVSIITDGTNKECDYYFAEFESFKDMENAVDEIIIYRWNRHYPADLHFDISLDNFKMTDTYEFAGTSHEKITRETYTRDK